MESGDRGQNVQNVDIIGDSNRDGLFDLDDILQVLASGKYSTGESATFEEGDWNGDGRFDVFDIILAQTEGNFQRGPEEQPAFLAESYSEQTSTGSVEAFDRYHTRSEEPSIVESLETKQGVFDSIALLAAGRHP